MANLTIVIVQGNTSDGSLKLSDRDHTKARKSDNIKWKIAPHSRVECITDIKEKKSADDIWLEEPHKEGSHWAGKISPGADVGDQYPYSIYWKAPGDKTIYIHDPIISIRPNTVHDLILQIVLIIFSGFLGFFTMQSLLKKKSGK